MSIPFNLLIRHCTNEAQQVWCWVDFLCILAHSQTPLYTGGVGTRVYGNMCLLCLCVCVCVCVCVCSVCVQCLCVCMCVCVWRISKQDLASYPAFPRSFFFLQLCMYVHALFPRLRKEAVRENLCIRLGFGCLGSL